MSKSPITDERLLNDGESGNGWKSEALAVISDISSFVSSLTICELLPCNQNGIYLNLETKENKQLTIEMSSAGFRVCGQQFDTHLVANDNTIYYETPYALLDSISPAYRQCFGEELISKLKQLANI
jgi:hypothetical protein